jgi:glycine hydroxymethyltransferase
MKSTKGLDNYINSTLGLQHGYLAKMLELEEARQEKNIELIASENYTSEAVRLAMASCLTNKYAEGYSGNRYYGGCEFIDKIEDCCKQTWQRVFNTDYSVNVQPHSGSQANLSVYNALLRPNETILTLDLTSGGHLSHGAPANLSGKVYNIVYYNLLENGRIDLNDFADKIEKFQPKLVIAGGSAYSRKIDFSVLKKFIELYSINNAYFMVDMAHIAGLIAAGAHPSPFGYADIITTTTHKTLRGPRGGLIFCRPELEKKINSGIFPGMQGGPLEHVILAKAVCAEECLQPSYKEYIF